VWVFFDGGFVSIVDDLDSPKLLIRARDRDDLVAFCNVGTRRRRMPPIEETPANDYRFRVRLTRRAVGSILATIAFDIDYPNFKERIHVNQGVDRARIYSGVWREAARIDSRHR
jgi:hypothetical protein